MVTQINKLIMITILMKTSLTISWYFDPCRITTSENGTFTLCQQQADCANQVTGSTIQCSQYTYTQLSLVSDCVRVCCFELSPVPTQLNGALVQQCYNQAYVRKVLYVVKVMFIVTGVVGIFVFIIACYVCAFVKNPYTGKRVYVGCCCCKKVPDFQKYRNEDGRELQNNGKSQDIMMENEKKINKIDIS